MGDRGNTEGTIRTDYSIKCIRCGDNGVVIDPLKNKPGKLCAECFISALSELFLMSEAEEILTTGRIDEEDLA